MKKIFALILGATFMYQSQGHAANLVADFAKYTLNPGQYYIGKLCGPGSNTVFYEYTDSNLVGLTAAGWQVDRSGLKSDALENAVPEFNKSKFVISGNEGNSTVGVRMYNHRTNAYEILPLAKIVKRIEAPEVKKIFYCLDNTGTQLYLSQGEFVRCLLKGCTKEVEANTLVTYDHETTMVLRHVDSWIEQISSYEFRHNSSHRGSLKWRLSPNQ